MSEELTVFKKKRHLINFDKVKDFFLGGIESYKIILIDGAYDPLWSNTTHKGVDICILSSVLENDKYSNIISKYYNKLSDTNESFSLLNSSFSKEGAYIHIPKNIELDKPIEIIHINSGGESSLMLQPRNLIILEKGSNIEKVIHETSTGLKLIPGGSGVLELLNLDSQKRWEIIRSLDVLKKEISQL